MQTFIVAEVVFSEKTLVPSKRVDFEGFVLIAWETKITFFACVGNFGR